MTAAMWRMFLHGARLTAGTALIAVGIVGLFLPVLQGWAMIFVGALLLGFDRSRISSALRKVQLRWPWTGFFVRPARRALHWRPLDDKNQSDAQAA